MRSLAIVLRLSVVMSITALVPASAVLARSWSYHYHPEPIEPTAAATSAVVAAGAASSEQFAEAKLVKLAIVTDLAIYAQDQNPRPASNDDHMAYVVSRLSRFDGMTSPDALKVFASLSDYYLGAPGEKLYSCLALRKGKSLQPFLEEYFHGANAECQNDLGPSFAKPSPALDGYAVCRSPSQRRERLRGLIADIDIGASCGDSDFTNLTHSVHN